MKKSALGKIERLAERAIQKTELPGFVLWVAREGDVVYHEAFGEAQIRPHRRPMKPDTVFDLASLTKVLVTTIGIMKLAERGRIDLAAPVASILPAFGERDEKKRAITVRHLLTHSSGLKAWAPYYEDIRRRDKKRGTKMLGSPEARDYVLERIAMSGLIHDVGEAAVYGDLGFMALGALLERVDGRDLPAIFAEEVAGPLGLRESGFIPLDRHGGAAARPGTLALPRSRFAATEECSWRERVLVGEVDDSNAWAMGGVAGHAGLFGGAADVGKIGLALLEAREGRGDFIARPVVEQFFARQDLPPGSDWALGWDTPTEGFSTSGRAFSKTSVGHTGFTGTSLWIDLERRIVIVLLANRIHPIARKSRFAFRPRVHDIVMEGLGFPPPPREKRPAAVEPDAVALRRLPSRELSPVPDRDARGAREAACPRSARSAERAPHRRGRDGHGRAGLHARRLRAGGDRLRSGRLSPHERPARARRHPHHGGVPAREPRPPPRSRRRRQRHEPGEPRDRGAARERHSLREHARGAPPLFLRRETPRRGGGHPREDHHHFLAASVPRARRTGPLASGGRRGPRFRRRLPARKGRGLRPRRR